MFLWAKSTSIMVLTSQQIFRKKYKEEEQRVKSKEQPNKHAVK
jgi:hypothetical protein